MTVPAAVWCIACGATPDVAITLERRGVLAHYGSCWDHVAIVAVRARRDASRIDAEDQARALERAQQDPARWSRRPDELEHRPEEHDR